MQNRSLLLVAVLGSILLATLWRQSAPSRHALQTGSTAALSAASGAVAYANPPASRDTLSNAKALERTEDLFRLQADLMRAQAAREGEHVDRLLHTAIRELGTLARRPRLSQRPQFRRVFRALTTEYEARYGVPDTLHLPEGPIYDFRTDLFASVNRDKTPSLVHSFPTDLREQDTDIPLPVNEPVRESIAFLLDHKSRYLYPWLRRASTYFPMIEQIFAEENVPDELKYLSLAESGLNPHAHSRANARGIWQFMARTGRQYGLSIDPWVDERLDPEKSTRAAARHLRDLYQQFGDWQLALAGYNCNPGVVAYHLRQYRRRTGRTASFWDIYDELPAETRNYVPLFTATAIVLSNPATFDLKRVEAGPRYAFDYVPVDASITIGRVAHLAEVDTHKVRVLNPELRSNRLPPSEEPYYVRLPHGTYSTFASNYSALPEEERKKGVQHVLQAGETAGRVAQRYHVERSDLMTVNDVSYPVQMRVGQRIDIPDTEYKGNSRIAESADGEPIRVRYGSRTIRPVAGARPDDNLTAVLSPGVSAE